MLLPTRAKEPQRRRRKKRQLTRRCLWRLGSSRNLKRAHNPKVAGSNPAPATIDDEGLADAKAASPFLYPGIASCASLRSRRGLRRADGHYGPPKERLLACEPIDWYWRRRNSLAPSRDWGIKKFLRLILWRFGSAASAWRIPR